MLPYELGKVIIACLWIKSSYELLFTDRIIQEGIFKTIEAPTVELKRGKRIKR
jgi:hypothetical protein